jgi:hypothetical protein
MDSPFPGFGCFPAESWCPIPFHVLGLVFESVQLEILFVDDLPSNHKRFMPRMSTGDD